MNEETKVVEKTQELEGLKLLLDTSYPLLKKFRDACPGTYKHSQAVSSMIEGIALSLNLDVDCMKVAALYHDVGKIFNPKYFTENQLQDEDFHANLDPIVSYNIITRHVSDSVVVLINDGNFPRRIIEIIGQHHGSTVLKYFFSKSGETVEDLYRYKTAEPQCVESAILMITDCIEARSRSLIQNNKFESVDVVETTITSLLDDGQLDSVYMKLGDLKKIKEALAKELEGMYQKRISYPDEDSKKKE